MDEEFSSGPWHVSYSAADGGRLTSLKYRGQDLLTLTPRSFRAPRTDYGLYETRPVFGYDDCFPSVGACRFPESDWEVPDHGELCWLSFTTRSETGRLIFQAGSRVLPVKLERALSFSRDKLDWQFRVRNAGTRRIPFQHIMHPLMPVKEVMRIDFPEFSSLFDERAGVTLAMQDPAEVEAFLLSQPVGSARMLFLRDVSEGDVTITLRGGLRLRMSFPQQTFPTIGVWWNNGGYPAEEGCRRFECAFEPTPGGISRLDTAYAEGRCQFVEPGSESAWSISWSMEGP